MTLTMAANINDRIMEHYEHIKRKYLHKNTKKHKKQSPKDNNENEGTYKNEPKDIKFYKKEINNNKK